MSIVVMVNVMKDIASAMGATLVYVAMFHVSSVSSPLFQKKWHLIFFQLIFVLVLTVIKVHATKVVVLVQKVILEHTARLKVWLKKDFYENSISFTYILKCSYNTFTSPANCLNTTANFNSTNCWSHWCKKRTINWLRSTIRSSCWSHRVVVGTTSCSTSTSISTCICST